MGLFHWEEGEVQPTDPPHVQAAERNFNDGREGRAGLGCLGMIAGAIATVALGPVGTVAGVAVLVVSGLLTLSGMPRAVRRLALALVVLAGVGVLMAFGGR